MLNPITEEPFQETKNPYLLIKEPLKNLFGDCELLNNINSDIFCFFFTFFLNR